ncbi:methyltransferase domain-containing protein [Microbispora triticiradicis]|uniref:Class I SAM-dependent methyltransferase n=3 Tax=Microbispora TaxID=2005 RepID=A0ABY3LW47_9ACTN|nr:MULTISPECIES: methyltransferase domain-containing protein [Microbispora]RGA02100.1 methyltransferase domain-containing protein [Microbispora triticiradicis]TLP51533.1 class I SAM-dependent methyltransferase [Microbispora fusca]TYB57104.1 class I SAM-dependent methyltransferase [Microbispora tritici]
MLPIPANELNGPGTLGPYWTFYHAVVAEQLRRWLPARPSLLLDLSGGRGRWPAQAARAGHRVVEVVDFRRPADPWLRDASERIQKVRADDLGFLPDGSVDGVIAEERVLSVEIMAESVVEDVARVLRPGGRALLCVDSLVLGMAILAEQNYWAHLCQTGEVMLIPWPDGSITRCFTTQQVRELVTGAGLEVEWVRPRTVLSPSTVDHVLSSESKSLSWLVRTELETQADGDDTVGIHLVASVRKPS